jgi:predicted nucleotidyltransferase
MVEKITKQSIIEEYLNDYDKRFYLREIAALLGKPHQSIKPFLEQLVKEGILIKERRKNVLDYKLNFKDKKIYDYLIIAEKERLFKRLNKDILLKTLFEKLSSFFNEATFIIFGSFAKQGKAEDIDLAVVGDADISSIIDDFEKIYNRKIHLIKIKDIKSISLSLIREIYKKHLILNNTESIIRYFGELYENNKLV